MARRIAWWVGVENISKNSIVAFTFTERAAEEMKFRIPDLDGTNHAGRRGSTLGLGTCRRENDYRDAEAIEHRTEDVVPRSLDQVNLLVETVNRMFAFQRSVLLAHSARNRHTFELSR